MTSLAIYYSNIGVRLSSRDHIRHTNLPTRVFVSCFFFFEMMNVSFLQEKARKEDSSEVVELELSGNGSLPSMSER